MASSRTQPAAIKHQHIKIGPLVGVCDHCGKRITDVLDWVVIETVELCAACYAATTRRQERA